MNWPNVLTMSRFVLAAILVVLLNQHSFAGNLAAVIVFAIASLTDYYDGYLAKRCALISDFGKLMDPIADKVLILSVFAVLAQIGMVAWWMVVVIALREAAVTVSRLSVLRKGQVLPAERTGKIKTVVQIAAISVILLFLVAKQGVFASSWFTAVELPWRGLINVLMLAAVVLTVGSGFSYFRSLVKKDQHL